MRWLILFAAVTHLVSTATASENIRVVDGDTIVIGETTYRLHGIDAPEYGQRCVTPQSGTWACGKEAVAALEAMVLGNNVACDDRGTDDYGRTIAVCRVEGRDINAAMVESGMAWAFRRYSSDYVAIEADAEAHTRGVWVAPTQTPWDYRAERWVVAAQEAPEGCPIKGNISRNGRIYHAPWSPWYSRTKLSPEKGERWFCDEAEAIAAGWRAPYWGR